MKIKIYKLKVGVILTLANLLIITSIFAQTPQKLSYQAVVRNNSDALIINSQVGMQISILQGVADGMVVYTEIQTPTTNANGLISIEIGSGAGFSTINWANDIYFIKTETDPTGGENYTITGTSQLLSVPYALHAKSAETVSGGIIETDPVFGAWDKTTGISIAESQISDLGTYIETETQTLSDVVANNNIANAQIKNLTDPTEAQDTATKAYVDQLLSLFEDNGMVVVDFSVADTDISLGNSVIFTDNSVLVATTWQWAFGDGNTSTEQNPTHTYTAEGTYSVSLTASNVVLSSTKTKNDYITVTDDPFGSFTDSRDGTEYQTITIGNQEWMAENLKYLPSVVGPGTDSQTTPYYYVYGYDGTSVSAAKATANYTTYGVLYNWSAAMAGSASSATNPSGVQGVCPTGWHLPSDAEWKELEMSLGMSQAEADNTGWRGTNEGSKLAGNAGLWLDGALESVADFGTSGFTALPGGYRDNDGTFDFVGYCGFWCSATEYVTSYAWYRYMNYGNSVVNRDYYSTELGFSVRCVRD